MMWPILACGVIALALVLERLSSLKRAGEGAQATITAVLDKVKRNQIKEAVQSCESSSLPVTRVLRAGILKYDRPRSQIKEALEEASQYEIPRLEKNLPFLATIAQVAPLLGLLGTAAGLAACFYAVYASGASAYSVPAADLASGIWRSLMVTCSGLAVAIPAFTAYNYLVAKVNSLIQQMEQASTELVNSLSE
ncbi:MAG: MotA/TolQ/ExbB proton channel family protein [Deltaproteobacteria bacterium]